MAAQELSICLWFDSQAEEAANHYASIFNDFEMGNISRYGKAGFEFHGKPEGTAMTVSFKLNNMKFLALNGGPKFVFNESISIVVNCETQTEIDHYWTRLSEDGEEGPCGWLKDKFGISWQIVPTILGKLLSGDPEKSQRVMAAYLQMKKFEIEKLQQAFIGN